MKRLIFIVLASIYSLSANAQISELKKINILNKSNYLVYNELGFIWGLLNSPDVKYFKFNQLDSLTINHYSFSENENAQINFSDDFFEKYDYLNNKLNYSASSANTLERAHDDKLIFENNFSVVFDKGYGGGSGDPIYLTFTENNTVYRYEAEFIANAEKLYKNLIYLKDKLKIIPSVFFKNKNFKETVATNIKILEDELKIVTKEHDGNQIGLDYRFAELIYLVYSNLRQYISPYVLIQQGIQPREYKEPEIYKPSYEIQSMEKAKIIIENIPIKELTNYLTGNPYGIAFPYMDQNFRLFIAKKYYEASNVIYYTNSTESEILLEMAATMLLNNSIFINNRFGEKYSLLVKFDAIPASSVSELLINSDEMWIKYVFYNLACIKSINDKSYESLICLNIAAQIKFDTLLEKLKTDPDLKNLRNYDLKYANSILSIATIIKNIGSPRELNKLFKNSK